MGRDPQLRGPESSFRFQIALRRQSRVPVRARCRDHGEPASPRRPGVPTASSPRGCDRWRRDHCRASAPDLSNRFPGGCQRNEVSEIECPVHTAGETPAPQSRPEPLWGGRPGCHVEGRVCVSSAHPAGGTPAPQHRIMAEDVRKFPVPNSPLLFLHLSMLSQLDHGQ